MKAEFQALQHVEVRIPESKLPPPIITSLGPKNWWRLEQEYVYDDGNHRITVPAGFEFNMASIPRHFWGLIAPFELSVSAPLVHDFMYHHQGKLPAGSIEPKHSYTRQEADLLFRRMMEEEGVPAWRRPLAYYAVRAFGGFAWNRPPSESVLRPVESSE
jgi:hypothetical protein